VIAAPSAAKDLPLMRSKSMKDPHGPLEALSKSLEKGQIVSKCIEIERDKSEADRFFSHM
jgi:hypothetical protein